MAHRNIPNVLLAHNESLYGFMTGTEVNMGFYIGFDMGFYIGFYIGFHNNYDFRRFPAKVYIYSSIDLD